MRTEKELDFLENHIPALAQNALNKAYVDALSKGSSVLETIGNNIVEVFPDGTKKIIKSIGANIKVHAKTVTLK